MSNDGLCPSDHLTAMIRRGTRGVLGGMRALDLTDLATVEVTGSYVLGRDRIPIVLKARRRTMADESGTRPETGDFAALIIAVAERHDRVAFAQLFEHFAPRIKSMLLRMGSANEQAEELAQEAMLTVWRKAHFYDLNSGSASAWIFRIAHNLRIDAIRRSRRIERLANELAAETAEVVGPDAIVDANQIEEKVRAALAQLSPEQMKVITLSFFESRPHSEIAQILQLPLGTVKSRIRLAFKRLRTLLDEVA